MAPLDPTLINDELLLREAIAAAAGMQNVPRRWMARFGGFSVGRDAAPSWGRYRSIRDEMAEKLRAKAIAPESAKW